ncbi:CRTAC1 family protein, partial [bacterium]|nr:CRTAC1 family protein [bacterium]
MHLRPHIPWIATLLLALPAAAAAGFVEIADSAGLIGAKPTWGAQLIDMDADGDLDLFDAHHFLSGYLFTNVGGGSFDPFVIPQIIHTPGDRHGYLWIDLDGDDALEVVCSHGGNGGCNCSDDGNELWRGSPGGVFTEVVGAGGMTNTEGRGRAFSAADIDGDGDLDLFHAKAPLDVEPNSLYRNDGGLSFTDVAADWGVALDNGPVGSLLADVDGDGDPDLLLGGDEFGCPTTYHRNDGGAFVDVTASVFGTLPIVSWADWGDLDNDGDLDLLLAEGHEGVYDTWRQDGTDWWFFANHRFDDDGVDAFSCETPGDDGVAAFRLNGSIATAYIFLGPGAVNPVSDPIALDDTWVGAPAFTPGVDHGLYVWRESAGGAWQFRVSAPPGTYGNFSCVVASPSGVTSPSASNLETLSLPPAAPRVWRNDGATFTEVTLGLTPSVNLRAAVWVDFDNDGDADIHAVNRGTVETDNEDDVLWRNDGGAFTALTGTAGVPGPAQWMSDGPVWGDIDRDGDLDVLVQEGFGALFFTDGARNSLYRNDGANGHWLTVQPHAGPGGATPVGVHVSAWTGGGAVHGWLHANSWRGFQRPNEIHLGLGAATWVDSLVVTWPGQAGVSYPGFAADQVLQLAPGSAPTGVGGAVAPGITGSVWPQPARFAQWFEWSGGGTAHVRVVDLAGRTVRDLGRRDTTGRVTDRH